MPQVLTSFPNSYLPNDIEFLEKKLLFFGAAYKQVCGGATDKFFSQRGFEQVAKMHTLQDENRRTLWHLEFFLPVADGFELLNDYDWQKVRGWDWQGQLVEGWNFNP